MRWEATVDLIVFFESESDDPGDEELEARTADAIAQGHILDSEVTDHWPAEQSIPPHQSETPA